MGRSKLVRVRENRELELYNYESETVAPCLAEPKDFLTDSVHLYVGGKILFTSDN